MDENAEKWATIAAISARSSRYGDLLIELMESNGAENLQEITLEQVRQYAAARGIRIAKPTARHNA